MKKKILWLSRHEMTKEQKEGLEKILQNYYGGPVDVTVDSRNMTFPAKGLEAAIEIVDILLYEEIDVVTGVFPAHVAVHLAEALRSSSTLFFVPVAVPSDAKEGEVRGGGFVHSHWECLNIY